MITTDDSRTIAVTEWLALLEREYLADYIGRGGAAVKFCIPVAPLTRSGLKERLLTLAKHSGYLAAVLDAADERLHMIDRIFFWRCQGS